MPPINLLLQQYLILLGNDEANSATDEIIAANKMQNH
tara:strand:+ start:411 stop:521 length:111 start_codon:yes stop_codon:yes gene_type:complete